MGKANRRKRVRIFWSAVICGLVISGVFALVLYLINRRGAPIFGGGE